MLFGPRWLWFVAGAVAAGLGVFFFGKQLAGLACKTGLLGEGAADNNAVAVAVRQIRRYAFAASQDKSPIVGLTHASYALVLLDTLEEIAGKDAGRAAGVDTKALRRFITTLQDKHAESMNACDPHLQMVLAIEKASGFAQPGRGMAGAPLGA